MPTLLPTIDRYMTTTPRTISPRDPLTRAHDIMRAHRIRHLPVILSGRLVGVVTMTDLHLMETLPGVDPGQVPVEDAMSEHVVTVEPDAPLYEVAEEMLEKRVGSVMVLEHGRLVGIFTTADALRALVEQRGAPPQRATRTEQGE